MQSLIRFIDKLSQWGGYAAGLMICVGLLIVLVEILLRSVFNSTIYVTDEYSGYLMCGLSFFGLAYTLKEKGHIRMVFLHKSLSPGPRIYLETACLLAGLLFCLYFTYFTGDLFWDSYISKSQSMQITETYLAVPQFLMPLGCLLLTLQFCSGLMKAWLTIKGRPVAGELIQIDEDLGR